MPYSDDPVRDFEMHDAEKSEKLDRLPECDNCNRPIQQDTFFLYRGDKICRECMETEFIVWTEDYTN